MMPFIVTTKRLCKCDGSEHLGSVSRRAVATLEDAIDWIASPDSPAVSYEQLVALDKTITERGGTVGPLPDGTEIEVAPVGEDQLRAAVAYVFTGAYEKPLAEVIDAWNARQS